MAVEISLRTAPRGGEIKPPTSGDKQKLLGAARLLLLIHGYNNDLDFARNTAYPGFESLQREIAGVGADGDYAPGWRVVKVYWPGDADYGLVSPLFYPWIVKKAQQTGQMLANFLDEVAGSEGMEVAIICHSLGCRVVAELLNALPENNQVRVSRVALFAAAVATQKLEDQQPGMLGRAFGNRIEDSALSLYSGADMVLALAFPLGQTLAPGDEGFIPTALGHQMWTSSAIPGLLYQAENINAGHSDYWGWEADTRDTCGRFASEATRDSLRLGTFAQRSVPRRSLQIRTAADARKIGERQTGAWDISLL